MRDRQSSRHENFVDRPAGSWSRTFLIALLAAALAQGAYAQVAKFQHWFGADKFIHPGAIEQTSDGGAIAVGSAGNEEGLFVVKLTAAGSPQWGEFLSLEGSLGSIHVNIRQTSDGGYILAGRTLLAPIVLIKLSSTGVVQWAKAYDEKNFIADFDAPQVRELAGGGYVIAGTEKDTPSTPHVGVLLLTDKTGGVIGGGKYFGENGVNIGFTDVRQNADGSFTVAGWLDPTRAPRGFLLALRTSIPQAGGVPPPVAWAEIFDSPFGFGSAFSNAMVERVNGGFIFAASAPIGTLLVRTGSNGISAWSTSFKGFEANSIHVRSSSGLLLGGSAGANVPVNPAMIATDNSGMFLKGKIYQTQAGGEGAGAAATTDGGAFLVAGISQGLLVVKADAALSSGCLEAPFAPTQGGGAEGISVVLNPGGGLTSVDLNVDARHVFRHDSFCTDPPCITPPTGMTFWLPLDELTGPTALNAAGGNQGVYHGNPVPTPGYVDGGLCFDGDTSYVEVPSYPAIDFGLGDFSLDAWVRRSPGDNGVRKIVDKRADQAFGASFRGYSFFLLDGDLWFQLADGPYSNYDSGVTVPLDGQWHHVAVTVSRHDPTGGRFYLDGLPVGTPFDPTKHSGSLASGFPLRVGSRSFSVSAVFRGCIDEVETFSRVLSPSEVAALHGARRHGKCKLSCQLPPVSSFCPGDASMSTSATICNSQAVAASFSYEFQGLPLGAGCTGTGPAAFTPALGSIQLQPGSCASLPVKIALPAGALPFPQVGCYDLRVQGGAGTLATACRGALRQGPVISDPRFGTVFDCPISRHPSWELPELLPVSLEFLIRSEGTGSTSFPYRLSATEDDLSPTPAISLDGQPSGTAVEGTLVLVPGTSTSLDVLAAFPDYQAGRFFNLLLEGDLDGSGQLQPLSSAVLRNVIAPTCTAPVIVQPPATSQVVVDGSSLILSVVAENTGTATYRWRHNGVELTDGGTVSGAKTSILKIDPSTFADAGLYEVTVASSCGAATSPPAEVAVAGSGTACTPALNRLCLHRGRFSVQASWQTAERAGTGEAVQVTGDTGYFWFFDPTVVELGVKVLDACSLSGRIWIFVGGLTDVEATVTVTDTRTGAVKTYRNPLGQAFLPIQDTAAFAACSAADAPAEDRAEVATASLVSTELLLGGRFRVEARSQAAPGVELAGRAVPLTAGSGAFWFFDPGNLELFIKILDGCGLGGHFWVFVGGLTDVEVDLTVTDTLTGIVKTYHNPRGRAFTPIQDTEALSTCP